MVHIFWVGNLVGSLGRIRFFPIVAVIAEVCLVVAMVVVVVTLSGPGPWLDAMYDRVAGMSCFSLGIRTNQTG